MNKEMSYVVIDSSISRDVLLSFDCKHPDFNLFLVSSAMEDCKRGVGVTYLLVWRDEYEANNVSHIFAFATIKTSALYNKSSGVLKGTSAVELCFFAIDRIYQGQSNMENGQVVKYSEYFLKLLLFDSWAMSVSVIGFSCVFLRANELGLSLYKRIGFLEIESTCEVPICEEDKEGLCSPLVLDLQSEDVFYSLFEK